ncbi:GAF domain-containing protein, partial [Streptomyces sp. NPDC050529]
MTTPHALGRLLLTPVDSDAQIRTQRLRSLGLGERSDASFDNFDAFADRVAEVTDVPFSMVNFIDGNRQFFAGLHTPAGTWKGSDLGAAAAGSGPPRPEFAHDPRIFPPRGVRRNAQGRGGRCGNP